MSYREPLTVETVSLRASTCHHKGRCTPKLFTSPFELTFDGESNSLIVPRDPHVDWLRCQGVKTRNKRSVALIQVRCTTHSHDTLHFFLSGKGWQTLQTNWLTRWKKRVSFSFYGWGCDMTEPGATGLNLLERIYMLSSQTFPFSKPTDTIDFPPSNEVKDCTLGHSDWEFLPQFRHLVDYIIADLMVSLVTSKRESTFRRALKEAKQKLLEAYSTHHGVYFVKAVVERQQLKQKVRSGEIVIECLTNKLLTVQGTIRNLKAKTTAPELPQLRREIEAVLMAHCGIVFDDKGNRLPKVA